jgi:hypothetical protein
MEKSNKKRIDGFDTLRGFAILLMIIDHVAAIIFLQPINDKTIRFITRLSEPLFIILFGYFLAKRERTVKRLFEILAASIFVNLFYYPITGSFEILASVSIAYVIFLLFKPYFPFLFFLAFLLSFIDPTKNVVDYPISIVLMQAVIGYLLKDNKVISAICLLLMLFLYFIPNIFPNVLYYTLIFTLPAFILFLFFDKYLKELKLPIITLFGRYPLTSYVLQYLIIVYLALFIILLNK